MDAAKALACEDAARIVTEQGPLAATVSVYLRGLTREAFDAIPGETTEHPGGTTKSVSKVLRCGSDVVVVATFTEPRQ